MTHKTIHGQKICRHLSSAVINSRDEGDRQAAFAEFRYIKYRRRKCLSCGFRFTTFELTMQQIDKWSDGVHTRSDNLLQNLRSILEKHTSVEIEDI